MSTMNYYVVLGIAEDADSDTIRSAFRALARRYHPDAGAGSSSAEFRRALEAYETLSDPARRQLYDRDLRGTRARPTIIPEPIGSRSAPEPLFPSRAVFFGFPRRPVTVTRSTFFDDDVFDELFRAMEDDWLWRWRVR
jgi:curved DNA-binding protein CbpA